jgi:RNA polymerase-associated protein RTF1
MEVSSSEDERELDMETFDTHELVQGEEDQKYLDSLPELEREAILGERFEKLKSAADMKKALRESK